MQITNEIIAGYKVLYDELAELQVGLSKLLNDAKKGNGDRKVKLVRDGKKIELTENTLWQEVYYMGEKCQAGEYLTKEYPRLFEVRAKEAEKVKEIKEFETTNFGFNYTQMTLPNTISLIRALVDFELCNRK